MCLDAATKWTENVTYLSAIRKLNASHNATRGLERRELGAKWSISPLASFCKTEEKNNDIDFSLLDTLSLFHSLPHYFFFSLSSSYQAMIGCKSIFCWKMQIGLLCKSEFLSCSSSTLAKTQKMTILFPRWPLCLSSLRNNYGLLSIFTFWILTALFCAQTLLLLTESFSLPVISPLH